MREKQFRLFFKRAMAKQGITGDVLLAMCECRLDNIVYRLGFSPSRPGARQLVNHRHVTVNGKLCDVPSAIVRPGDVVAIREKDRNMIAVLDSLKRNSGAQVGWLSLEEATMQGTLLSVPERAEIPENLEMQLIVELYSR
jgi:small subunit ribosomal protein S4